MHSFTGSKCHYLSRCLIISISGALFLYIGVLSEEFIWWIPPSPSTYSIKFDEFYIGDFAIEFRLDASVLSALS